MGAVVAALTRELIARYRWLFLLTGVWLALLCVLGLLLPPEARNPTVGLGLTMALVGPLLFVAGALAHGYDARLEESNSGFPVRLFTLPAPAVALVGPPLVLGTAVVFVCWELCALCLLRGCGVEAPLIWPALFGAALLALLQALTWSPFPLPWLRLVSLGVLVPALFWGMGYLVLRETDERVLTAIYLPLLVLGYAGALLGVKKSRRGEGVREPLQIAAVFRPAGEAPARFTSPLRAQVWLEWQLHCWLFFSVAVLATLITLPMLYFADQGFQNELPHFMLWWGPAVKVVGASWLVMSQLLTVPFIMTLAGSAELGRLTAMNGGYSCPAFLATRPITTTAMVHAKLLMLLKGVLWIWVVVIAAGAGWAVCMGRVGEMTERLVAVSGSGPAAVGVLLGGLALLMVINWLWLVEGLWVSFLGRTTIVTGGTIVKTTLLTAAGVLAANWRPEWLPVLTWSVAAALAFKALALALVVQRLRRERLMTTGFIIAAIAAWGLLAAVVVSVALRLTSGGALVAGITILLLPLARCLAAPLALARNRTR